MLSTHIKPENLEKAIEVLSSTTTLYRIEKGMVFGKECYWIESNGLEVLKLTKHLCQDSD